MQSCGFHQGGLTSKETEIKLTNVARASLEELLDDYKMNALHVRLRLPRVKWRRENKMLLQLEARSNRVAGCRTPCSRALAGRQSPGGHQFLVHDLLRQI